MILSCPSCSTRYFADGASLGEKGRSVRCAACGHTWYARTGAEAGAATGAADADADPLGDIDAPVAPKPAAKRPHQAAREKAAQRRDRRAIAAGGAVWAGAVALVAVVIGLAYAFRVDVVRAWPQAANAYALLGVEAKASGLVFENIAAARAFEDGETVLRVSATVRNLTGRARPLPDVRVSLTDMAGVEVYGWDVELEPDALQGDASYQFETRVAHPPAAAENLEMRFLDAAPRAEAPRSRDHG